MQPFVTETVCILISDTALVYNRDICQHISNVWMKEYLIIQTLLTFQVQTPWTTILEYIIHHATDLLTQTWSKGDNPSCKKE